MAGSGVNSSKDVIAKSNLYEATDEIIPPERKLRHKDDLIAALREVTTRSATNPNSAVASVLSRADLDAGIVDEATAALAKHASSTTSLGRVGAARAVASASKARYGTAGGGNASNTSGTRRGAKVGGGAGVTPNGATVLQDTTGSAIAELEHVVNANARKYNDIKFKSAEQHKELSTLLTELKDLQSENAKLGVGGGDEGGGDDASSSGRGGATAAPGISSTPEARRIAQLTRLTRETEEELAGAELRRGQYQHMLDRLRGNHVQFEGHMSAMQAALEATRAEFSEVEGNVRALENAKDASALDLAKYQQALGHLRTRRGKELENRKGELRLARKAQRLRQHREEVRAQLAAQISGDLSAEEEAALLRLRADKTSQAAVMERKREGTAQRAESMYAMFDRVRQATGCRDISQLVGAFRGQGGLTESLEQEATDVQGRLAVVNQAVDKAKAHLDNLRATGGAVVPSAVQGGPTQTAEVGQQSTSKSPDGQHEQGGGKHDGEESKASSARSVSSDGGEAVGRGAVAASSPAVSLHALQAGKVDLGALDIRSLSLRDDALRSELLNQMRSSIHAAERRLSQSTAAADSTEQALLAVQQVALGVARRLAPLCEILGLPAEEPWMSNADAVPVLLRAVREAHSSPAAEGSQGVSPVKRPPPHPTLPAVTETSISSMASQDEQHFDAEVHSAAPPALLRELGSRLSEEQVQLAASAPAIRKGRGLPTVMQVGAVHPALHCLLLLQCAQDRCERTLHLLQTAAGATAPIFNEADLIEAALKAQQGRSIDDVLPPSPEQHTDGRPRASAAAKRRAVADPNDEGPSASLVSVASSDYAASLLSPGASLGVPASPPPPRRTQAAKLTSSTAAASRPGAAAGQRETSHGSASSSTSSPSAALSPRTWGNLRHALAMRWAGDDSGSEEDEDAPSAQVRAALMGTADPGTRKSKQNHEGSTGNRQSSLFRSAKDVFPDVEDDVAAGADGTGTGVGHDEDDSPAGGRRVGPRGPLRRMHSNAATIMTSLSPREEHDNERGAEGKESPKQSSSRGDGTPPTGTAGGGTGTPTRPGAAVKVVTPDKASRPSTAEHGTPSTQTGTQASGTPGSLPRGMGSLAAALLREPPSSLLPTPAVSQRVGSSNGAAASLAPSFQDKSMEAVAAGAGTPSAGASAATGGLPPREAPPDLPPTAPAGLTLGSRSARVHKKVRTTSPGGTVGGVGAASGTASGGLATAGKQVEGGAAFAKPWAKMRTAVGGTMRFAVDEDEEAQEFEAARHRIKASSSALVAQEAELYILQQGQAEAAALAQAHSAATAGLSSAGAGAGAGAGRPASGKRVRAASGSLLPLDSGRGGAAGAAAAALGEDEIALRRRRAAKAAKAAAQNTAMRRLMQPEHNSKGGLSALMQKPTML